MRTQRLDGSPQGIARAGEILRAGGLVAIPTETVYGLAANALDGAAVGKIYAAKERPGDNPLIAHIGEISQLAPLVKAVPPAAQRLAEVFWPGPLTIILERSGLTAPEMSCGLDTVSVRLPAHPVARGVFQAAGVPLAAPSANRSGRPSPTRFSHVWEDLNGRVDAILDGGDCPVGVESTVVSLVGERPRLLRPGGVTLAQLEAILGPVEVDPAVLARLEPGREAPSPGMKYKHYAPQAEVVMVDASPEEFASYVNARAEEGLFALCFDETAPLLHVPSVAYGPCFDPEAQARRLFEALHQLDQLGARRVYAQRPSQRGVGLAGYNRQIRAAAIRVERPQTPAVIGLVGPSGAGKSTVARFLARQGFSHLDCDKVTKSAGVYDYNCIKDLREAFGGEVAPDFVLDRQALAQRAFQSPQGVRTLQAITFPRILAEVRRRMEARTGPLLLDAPTLFEAGLDRWCRRIVAVTAPKEERLRRVMARDGLTEAQALQRLGAQPEDEYYRERAVYEIENGPGADLACQVKRMGDQWKGR